MDTRTTENLTFDFHQDPGHAWLAVERNLLLQYPKVALAITPYSYQDGNMAYLEEDCDAHPFLGALRDANLQFTLVARICDREHGIRYYERFALTDTERHQLEILTPLRTLKPLPVGTQILSLLGETADTCAEEAVYTGANAIGVVSEVLPQEHCYAVFFEGSNVSVFLSPEELGDSAKYRVIPRVVARFQPQAWVNGDTMDIDGDCAIDVTEEVLALDIGVIQNLEDDSCGTDGLLLGRTGHEGPHHATVKDSVQAFFGIEDLSLLTEEMLAEKRQAYAKKPLALGNKLHNVHIYAVVRVEVRNIEATDDQAAIRLAVQKANLHSRLSRGNDQEYAELIDCFLVDGHGMDGVATSRWYGNDGETPKT